MTFFITGSNGFVGTHLCQELSNRNIPFKKGVRRAADPSEVSYGDLSTEGNWDQLFRGIDVVVHLAARVHVMNETSSDPLEEFRKTNVAASVRLAEAARASGVKRFIFLSSIKVNGEETHARPFRADDEPNASDPYGISKREAEDALLSLHEPGAFEVVVIRPPLIYGPGVKANFQSLMRLSGKSLPLPFGSVENRRSMVSVFNLVDLIILCSHHPSAGGNVFLVSDDHDFSLRSLITQMAEVQGRKALLLPVPVFLMKLLATLLGKKAVVDRLFGNLQVDIGKTKSLLGWKPKYGLRNTFSA